MSDAPSLANAAAAPLAPPPPAASPAQPSAPAPAQRVAPGSPEWAALTTEQRHAQLRGPENPRSRGHSPARDMREAASEPAAVDNAPKPDGEQPTAPPAKVQVGKYEVSEQEIGAMMERQAIEDQRRLTLPASAEAYEAKLPADLKLPAGLEYTFDNNDPSLIAARNLAHAKGWSQQDFSEALGIFASHIVGQQAAIAERSRAEIAKAGPTAPARVDAVGRFITGMVGDADAKQIRSLIVTDSMLRYHELVMTKLSSQGSASFSQQHRVPPDTQGIPGFENMSFEQRRLAQDQRAAARR